MTSLDSCRGHKLIPSSDVFSSWPKLYSTENLGLAAKVIHAHFFVGACDWWLAEFDPADKLAFGYVCLGDPQFAEWGYFDLNELALVEVCHPVGLKLLVERDLHWKPKPFNEIKEAQQ